VHQVARQLGLAEGAAVLENLGEALLCVLVQAQLAQERLHLDARAQSDPAWDRWRQRWRQAKRSGLVDGCAATAAAAARTDEKETFAAWRS
jgi:hypothetical protein